MMTLTFADAFQRTDAGRAEIKARAVSMTRPARNLLMVIDASCPARDWVGKVAGSSEADLVFLAEAGLIAPATATVAAAAAARGPTVEEALTRWQFDALYTLLTHEARERFGLIKGYRLILEIERCSGPEEIRAMALKFIDQLRAAHGEETAQRFARHLITAGVGSSSSSA